MRHIVITPVLDDAGPIWRGGSPDEQGYKNLDLPRLKRHEAKSNEYHVYTSKTEYKAVLAESAVNAVAESQVSTPVKVVHAHSRIADVMDTKTLEYIGTEEEEKNATEEPAKIDEEKLAG